MSHLDYIINIHKLSPAGVTGVRLRWAHTPKQQPKVRVLQNRATIRRLYNSVNGRAGHICERSQQVQATCQWFMDPQSRVFQGLQCERMLRSDPSFERPSRLVDENIAPIQCPGLSRLERHGESQDLWLVTGLSVPL